MSEQQNYEATGIIKKICEVQSFASGFSKRDLILTTNSTGKYPQDVKFSFLKDRGDLLDGFAEGDEVTVSFNIGGREYNGEYYNSETAWKIKATQERAITKTSAPTGEPRREAPKQSQAEDADDNLPF